VTRASVHHRNRSARRPGAAPLAALLVGALIGCSNADSESLAGRYPDHNVILISVDTLRADHLGAYGYSRPTSPTLDGIATESVVFDRAYAPAAATWPSLVSMLTALSPHASNVRVNGELLADDIPTLATLLHQRGYTTAAFLANACEAFTRDFDTRECLPDAKITAQALAWLEAAPKEPFFLWLHYLAPHEEYRPPPRFDRFTSKSYQGPIDGTRQPIDRATLGETTLTRADHEQIVGLYDGEILFTDTLIAAVWSRVAQLGLLPRSLAVVTADHGEELGDHHGYYYHICSVYEPALRIPLMVRLPDGAGAGRRVAAMVRNTDIAPTLLELLGQEAPESFEGVSRRALLEGEDALPVDSPSEFYRPGMAPVLSLRTDRWRYVYNPGDTTPECMPRGRFFEVGTEELYDQERDPLDQRDVLALHPDVAAELRERATRAYHVDRRAPAIYARPETMENLRALGYIVD
jgi:arylsulfatase